MTLQERIDKFHEHLDRCKQCRDQIFNLCPIGNALLMATAIKDVKPFGIVNTDTN